MKLLVAATLRSGAACRASVDAAAAASGESGSLTSASVHAPAARSAFTESTRSGLRPDCDQASASGGAPSKRAPCSVSSDGGSDVTRRPPRCIDR
jgi:hypothetical protein